jgi:manganese/zinc/iron transport system permease protein
MSDSIWIIATGSLIALSCSWVGNYLVLRKQAMMGDALSHAILPGLVLAYLMFGMDNILAYIIACSAVGIVSVALIDLFKRSKLVQDDIAIGLSFTSLFALGVILISMYAGKVHLDYDHVLYGEIAYVPLDVLYIDGLSIGPRTFWISLGMLVLTLLFVAICFRLLNLTSFNPEFARVLGVNPRLWHYILLSVVSVIVVISFESVGAILVVSFLIIPSATAYLISSNLRRIFGLSSLFAILSALGGYYLAYITNSSIAASMALVAGLIFILSFAWKIWLQKT